ncbi:MAG TPA: RNA polymerase sigma factor [Planctomycetota bacterium]|nr:RNA polymerase sigma factor [Planctomycetota bacterium]
MGNQEEAELVRQARQRAQPEAEQAFAALVRRWQLPLFRFVRRRIRVHHDAEEVTAESFVQAWRSLPTLEDPGAFPGWLHRIAWRQTARWYESRGMSLQATPVDEVYFDPRLVSVPVEIRDDLRKAFAEVPDADLRLLKDKYESNLTYQELADREGVSVSTIRDRLVAARDRLSGSLRRGGHLEEFRRLLENRRARGGAGEASVDG